MANPTDYSTFRSNTGVGVLLIVVGILIFLFQRIDFDLGRYGWPLFILIPGVLILAFSLSMKGNAGEGFTVCGSIVTMTGLLLFYQNATNHWESWAYAWALIAPTSIGIGQSIFGLVKRRQHIIESGRHLTSIGVAIFLGGAVFFELIIGISGHGLSGLTWAFVLIGLGVLLLLSNFLPFLHRESDKS